MNPTSPNTKPAALYAVPGLPARGLALALAAILAVVAMAVAALPAEAARTIARDDSYSLKEDTTLTVKRPGVLRNDSDKDGALKINFLENTDHGQIKFQENGSVTYTPKKNYNGTDTARYRACEIKRGNHCDTATVRFKVSPVNDGPDAVDDAYSTQEDKNLSVPAKGVLQNDKDIDGDSLTAELVSAPLHGKATVGEDGALDYDPNANYNGPDQITYAVTDEAGAKDMARVDITVGPQNDRPIARPDKYFTKRNHNRNITAPGVRKNDTDPDGAETTRVTHCGSHKHVRFTCYPSGAISARPDTDWTGSATVRYTIEDRGGMKDTSTVTMVVYKPKR